MKGYTNLKGEPMAFPVNLFEAHVRHCLSNCLVNHKEYELKITGKPKLGEGYICNIHYASLIRKNPEVEINIVIKCLKRSSKQKECPLVPLFQREIRIYRDIYPILKKFAQERGVNTNDNSLPRCLGYCSMEGKETIILENLKPKGYDIYKGEPLTFEHTVLALKALAKWHAFSYAFKDQKPLVYATMSDLKLNLYEALCKSTNLYQILRSPFDRTIEQLEVYTDPVILNVYKDLQKNFDELLLCRIKDRDEQYSVICHLDSWTNNFLFKQEGDRVVDVSIIDWQCSSFALPVFDVTHFLYVTSGEKQFEKIKDLLLLYHNSLSDHIRELGSDPEKLYPLTKFMEHWKEYSAHGLLLMPSVLSDRLAGDTFVEELNKRSGDSIDYQQIFIENVPKDQEKFKAGLLQYIKYYIDSA